MVTELLNKLKHKNIAWTIKRVIWKFFTNWTNYSSERLIRQALKEIVPLITYFVSEAPKFKNLVFVFLITLLKYSDFNGFDHISSQNFWFTFHIWYDILSIRNPIRNCIRFPDFFRFFSDFHQIFRFLSYDLMIFFSMNLSGFMISFRFFSDFHQIYRFIWNGWFTFQIWFG